MTLINLRKLLQIQSNLVTKLFDVLLCFFWGFNNLELQTFDLREEGEEREKENENGRKKY